MESFRHLHFYFSIAPRLVGLVGIAFRFFALFGGSFRGLAPDRSNDFPGHEIEPYETELTLRTRWIVSTIKK